MTTDDIVTRLRASYYASRTCFELLPDEIEDMREAANEIERLRQRHDTLNGQPLNWVQVAQRLVRYINDTGLRQFSSVQDALAYLDSLEAADGE